MKNNYSVDEFVDIVDSILSELYTDAESKEDQPLQVSILIISDKIRTKLGMEAKNTAKIEALYSDISKEKEFNETVKEAVIEVKGYLNKIDI